MTDLSVLIPARNEEHLGRTIECLFANSKADTEVIAVLDGWWPHPAIKGCPGLVLIHHSSPVGQRAAVNEAARAARGKYIMKLDAHCAVATGFDAALIEHCEPDMTIVPRMYELDVSEWKPVGLRTDFGRIDSGMKFHYWPEYEQRDGAGGQISDLMCSVGACFFMHRARFFELGGLDEGHGGWGRLGVEIACKSWLSGGRQVVDKSTWFAHYFRDKIGFPYPMDSRLIERAKKYSRKLWLNDRWPLAKRKLSWLIDRFSPVPDWDQNDMRETASGD